MDFLVKRFLTDDVDVTRKSTFMVAEGALREERRSQGPSRDELHCYGNGLAGPASFSYRLPLLKGKVRCWWGPRIRMSGPNADAGE